MQIACPSRYIHADVLENAVWTKIVELILHPERVISFLEENLIEQRAQEFENQLEYLYGELARLKNERTRWDTAYGREILSLDEYEAKVKDIQARMKTMEQSKQKIEQDYRKLQEESDLENEIKRRLAGLREGMGYDIPYELKRNILTVLVDKIVFNVATGQGTIYGGIPATHFEIHSAPI